MNLLCTPQPDQVTETQQGPTRPDLRPVTGPAPAPQVIPFPRSTPEPQPTAWLDFTRGPGAGTQFPVNTPSTTIGRARNRDIVIDDVTVSRDHATLQQHDGRYILVDGGSLNGTYLNRRPVDRAELADGDEIWVGTARFTFHLGA